tara:strand:- start:137 stop:343 length:207 start_codon:yes stop_codon:yes gene_type:complete
MKSTALNVKEKLIAKYLQKDTPKIVQPNIDVNVLLNRVKLNQKNEKRKKLYFSAAASTGLILFGILIF